MKTTEYVEYMAYPRALAMAEVTWTPADRREYADFLQRLRGVLQHLEALDINYRQPEELLENER